MPDPSSLLSLLANDPSWTDKEMLKAIGATIGAVIPVCLFTLQLILNSTRRRLRDSERKVKRLESELKDLETGKPRHDIAMLKAQLDKTEADAKQLAVELATANDKAASHLQSAELVKSDLAGLQQTLEKHQSELAAEQRRIKRAMERDGHTWTARVLAGAREFIPLEGDGRRMPIISVLNLKGGVGKTTITANLGAALDARGYRTLMLDLDLQGSLTGLFLPEPLSHNLIQSNRMVGDFLAMAYEAEYPNMHDYTQSILPDGKSGLVPTGDNLAYAEMNLTIRWLLRESNRDPRFLLRRELQFRRVTNHYDVVLLDCPPLINISCVNALAASDYVLIPIMPSKQATARVPVLLERLKEFRENINPDLKVLGIVCNRTHRSELTAAEESRLSLLREQCRDIWGEFVPQLDTFIRQSVEVRAAEDERRTLGQQDDVYQSFASLAAEVEDRLPLFCRPARDAQQTLASEVAS